MSKSKFSFLTLIAALGAVSVVTVGVVGVVNNESLIRGAGTTITSCGDVLFGAQRQTKTSPTSGTLLSTYYSSSNSVVSVSNITISGSVYASVYGSDYASSSGLKLGKTDYSGSITITFASSVLVTKVIVYAMCNSTSGSASAPFTVTTNGNGTAGSATCTTAYTVEGGDAFTLSDFASDTAVSTSCTITTTKTAASNALNLCKVVFAVSTSVPSTSSSSSQSSSSHSSSQSSSSSSSSEAKTLSSISASGMTKTSYTAGDSLDTTGLIVTASYSDGSNAPVTNYTTDPANGATLSTSNTSMTVNYTEGGITKTDSVALTVAASSKTLMVRFKEILASMYCDSIFIKYGDWECLIDGGNSADTGTVASALTTYCTDHKLDMYIATHSHNDHAGIFTDATTTENVFISGGITSIGTIIDCGSARSATFWTAYRNIRDDLVNNGKATYVPVHAFFNSDSGYTNYYGQNLFTVDSNVSMRFLNTGTYLTPGDNTTETGSSTYSPNRYSVACVLSAWNMRYIFSGDGDANTESGIISNNSDNSGNPLYWSTSNDVYLKANHHGSNTEGSNGATYLAWVKPNHILVSSAIVSANAGTSGVTAVQHPNPVAVQRMEVQTYDIHWTGINGTFSYTSTGGATPTFAGTAKTVPYYYNGSAVTGEETTTFPMSKWCTYPTYSADAKTSATGHDAKRFAAHVGVLANEDFDYSSLNRFTSNKEMVNAKGELYDELTDSYC